MKNLSRTLILVLIITTAIVFTACGNEKNKATEKESQLKIVNDSSIDFVELKLTDKDGKEVSLTKEKLEKTKSKDLSGKVDEIAKLGDDVRLFAKTGDNTVKEMVDFPKNDSEEIHIKNNGDVYYLEYKSLKTSKVISTESKEVEFQKVKSDENNDSKSEESVVQEGETERSDDGGGSSAVPDNSQSQTELSPTPAPSSTPAPAPSQPQGGINQDGCITDGILN